MVNDLRTINKQINDVVNYIVKHSCEETTTGNWILNYEEVSDLIDREDFDQFYSIIEEELRSRPEVLDVEPDYADSFDINIALDYCPNYEWCQGDEAIFGSFEEFQNREIKPVSQPISLTEQANAADRRTTLLYNSISLLAYKVFEEYDSVEELNEMLCKELGTTLEELKSIGIIIKPVDEPEIIGSITYYYNNETVEYTDRYRLIADFTDALDVHGPNGVEAKVFDDDDILKYQLDVAIYNVFGEEIPSFEEWKQNKIKSKIESIKEGFNLNFVVLNPNDSKIFASVKTFEEALKVYSDNRIADTAMSVFKTGAKGIGPITLLRYNGCSDIPCEHMNIIPKFPPEVELQIHKAFQVVYPFDEHTQTKIDELEKQLGIFERETDTSNDLYIGKWRVHLVPEGARYGRHNNLINENERTLIEFHDVSQDKEKFPEGQFTGGRYYVETILSDNGYPRHTEHGLSLDADIPAWFVSGDEMKEVFSWLVKQPLKDVDKPYRSLTELVLSAEKRSNDNKGKTSDNQYYKTNDGWFDYYVNKKTGEKKFKLDKDDVEVDRYADDFHR